MTAKPKTSERNDNTPRDIAAALARVRADLGKAAKAVGRAPGDVTLIAVSKTHDATAVETALAAGQRDFGENRVQEAQSKFPALKAAYPNLVLHLIGPLQSNKTKEAVALFDVIHSLDRPKLAEKLAEEMARQNKSVPCFIQVNTGREAQKAGIDPADVAGFTALCRDRLKLPVLGYMCIPPAGEVPAPHFAFLRELAQRHGLKGLSMGMSGDAVDAVRLGATHVRVGTAIFGARPTFAQS
ncbi:MAG: YggS family pyridoxal phosphate-dependent enzyme [Rhodospirillaceae bacterium]|nr:YggS family pyridoxal phosphate-dependent enzyme [Rhodospirillaceae bacterium]